MAVSTREAGWLRTTMVRGGLAGVALGAIALGGAVVVLAQTPGGLRDTAVLVATVLLSLAVGIWAGAPEAGRDLLPVRDRWLAAAALTAVSGSFSTFGTIYQQIYPGPWWGTASLVIVVAVPVYAVGMLLPVLLEWAERLAEREEEEDGGGWQALAPLGGAVLGGGVLGVLLSGILLLPRWSPGSVIMGASATLLLPLLLPEPDRLAPRETLLAQVTSPFGSLRVVEVVFPGERQPERRLFLNDEEESGELVRSGAPTLGYVAAAESWLTSTTPRGASYLFLGGGAYTLPRRIAERDPRAAITVVELDPEITRLAYRYFGLEPHHRITSRHGDARAVLALDDDTRYDRIYLDVYSGREALPYSLVTAEAARDILRKLRPGGLAGINLIGSVDGPESVQLWSIIRTYAEVFPGVVAYTHLGRDFPERQNVLLSLSGEPATNPPAAAGMFELWPREEWPAPAGTTVFRDLLPEPRKAPTARAESA
jgi:hypothetical protein